MIRVLRSEQQHSGLSAVLLGLFHSQLKETKSSKCMRLNASSTEYSLLHAVKRELFSSLKDLQKVNKQFVMAWGEGRHMWAAPFTLDLPPKSAPRPHLPQGRSPTNRSFRQITITDSRTQRQKFCWQMSAPAMHLIQPHFYWRSSKNDGQNKYYQFIKSEMLC